MAAALVLAQPRAARAENSLSYEYENYREMGGRITVDTDSAIAEQDLGTEMHFKLGGTIDTIAGATPTGQPAPAGDDQVPITHLTDRRHAWDSDFSRQFSAINVDIGFARSIEHDYMSNGWSVNTLTDFNQKNTTLLVGASGTDDNVEFFFPPGGWRRKLSSDVIAGVNQLIDPTTSASVSLTWSRETGFLNDQYKLVQEDLQILPGISLPLTFAENRPNQRDKGTVFASVNHAFPGLHGALEASYRFYHDTYSITANTAELLWLQHVGSRFILQPNLRLYHQSAANFYTYRLDGTGIVPTAIPNPLEVHYSSDARLSALDSVDFGLKAIWKVTDSFQFDIALHGYRERGTDEITPKSAYYRARVATFGSKISW
jgi:hypothetical protein